MTYSLAGMKLEYPLVNAAGTCKNLTGFRELLKAPVGAIMLGSYTLNRKRGNPHAIRYTSDGTSFNHYGLPNPGAKFLERRLPDMVRRAHKHGKKLFVSVAGKTPIEFAKLVEIVAKGNADLVEVNFGCAHVGGRVISYDHYLVDKILQEVSLVVGKLVVAVKLSPMLDEYALESLLKTIRKFPFVRIITTANTAPNGVVFSGGNQQLLGKERYGGMGGTGLRGLAQGQVSKVRELAPDIDVIGIGGVSHGIHLEAYLSLGAKLVGVGTHLFAGGTPVLTKIWRQHKKIH